MQLTVQLTAGPAQPANQPASQAALQYPILNPFASAMKIDHSWRKLSAVFTAPTAIFIRATFRRPSAAPHIHPPRLRHSIPSAACRLIWKIAPNICEARQKMQQTLKVAPALIVWICQYCKRDNKLIVGPHPEPKEHYE